VSRCKIIACYKLLYEASVLENCFVRAKVLVTKIEGRVHSEDLDFNG